MQSGKSAVELAAKGDYGRGHSEVLKVLCQHGASGAEVLVYEALSCAQVLVYEAFSDLEECDQVHFSA